MSNPVNWFEIYVQDMERAKAFYEAVLERKMERIHNPEIEMWNFPMALDQFGASGALVRMPGVSSGGNSTIIYFHAEDCAIPAERVKTFGGRVHKEKFSIGEYGHIALCYDTEGNMFGLHSMK